MHGAVWDHTDLEAIAAANAAVAARAGPDEDIKIPSVIKLRTYQPAGATTKRRRSSTLSMKTLAVHAPKATNTLTSSKPVSTSPPAAAALCQVDEGMSRPRREPRENCDFLRVCVLEMRMRRAGKLEAGVAGRARFWLPPRIVVGGAGEDIGVVIVGGKTVPRRWVGVLMDG